MERDKRENQIAQRLLDYAATEEGEAKWGEFLKLCENGDPIFDLGQALNYLLSQYALCIPEHHADNIDKALPWMVVFSILGDSANEAEEEQKILELADGIRKIIPLARIQVAKGMIKQLDFLDDEGLGGHA